MPRFRRLLTVTLAAAIAALAGAASAQAAPLKMFWDSPDMDGRDPFRTLGDLGVDVFQTGLQWHVVAPTRPADPTSPDDPAYRWPEALDAKIREAERRGIDVAVMLVGVPAWANGGRGERHVPDDVADFADFATAASRRYPSVTTWMIWGEPTHAGKFEPLTPQRTYATTRLNRAQQRAPRAYAKLLDAAYGALKAVDRRDKVVGAMTAVAGAIRPMAFVRYLRLPNGKPPRMDLYGHNPFSAREPDLGNPPSPQGAVDFSDLRRFQKVVDRQLARPRGKRRLPFFLSEFAIPTGPDSEFNFYTTPEVQARWITSAFRVARQVGAYGLGWIHLYDDPPGGSRSGLLTNAGKRKPGYRAFKQAR
jgi:hypothetical protein